MTAVSALALTPLPVHAGSGSTAAPKYGGTIKVGIFDTFSGFCVGNNLANSALGAARTVYETLFEKTIGGDMIGLLATGAVPSDDLKTWVVNLRPGVKFHDGTDFNSSAVITNFNAIRGMTHLASISRGGAKYLLGTGVTFSANIVSVTAVDDLTVRFVLDRPQNDLPATLYASGRFFMRAPAQLNSPTDCGTKAIGTGAFRMASWTPDEMVVTKNVDYWRTDPKTKAKLPYLDGITFTNVKEASQRSAAVRRGTLDAAMFSSATDSTFIRDLHTRTKTVNEYRSAREYYAAIWLNQAKPTSPFSNRDARLAVSYAFDAAGFAKVRTKNEGQAPDSIVGPSNVMYNRTGYIKFNLAKAKDAAAHYKATTGKDLEFTMPFDTSTASAANAIYIQRMMAKAGIRMNILTQELAVTLSQAFNTSTGGNDFDAIWLLLLEGTDASFNLPFLVSNMYPSTSTNPAKALRGVFGSLLGLSHHSDATIDADLFAGQAAKTKGEARTNYRKAVARIQSEAIVLPTVRQYYDVFTTKKLNGVGKLQIQKGKTQRITTNWGIDWTGVWKS